MRRKGLSGDEVTRMEEYRCRIVATGMEDSRCQSLLDGSVAEMEDPRCRSLHFSAAIEVEDCRSNCATILMEDPRCNNLHTRW